MGDIFSSHNTLRVISKSLGVLAQKQKVLSNNIANVDTPGFKRSNVDFQQVLKQTVENQSRGGLSLCTTDPKHLSLSQNSSDFIPVIKDMSSTYRKDGNNVDIEKEIVEINKNSLLYNSAVTFANNEFFLLKHAIEGGR